MKYKKSKYNIIIDRPEGKFLWNTCSNAFIKLNDEGFCWLEAFTGTLTADHFFEILLKNGCIVPDDLDETGKILYEEKAAMLNTMPASMHFTIAPGMGCNYNCHYCFEKGHGTGSMMSQETIHRTEEYIIEIMSANPNLKQLNIRWFGGEPLLYMNKIEKMSHVLMNWCAANDVQYTAGIVTNGRYLTAENARRLKEINIGYVQLSMDGMGKYYEEQKGAREGDFAAVVENLKSAVDLLDITIRINVEDSLDEALALTEYLLTECGLDEKLKVYVAHVRDYEGMTAEEEQMSHAHFLELEGQYISLFGKDGPYSRKSLGFILPKRRCTTCRTVCGTNFCIGPEGELYRCEHYFGHKDFSVGNVFSGRSYPGTELEYIKYRHLPKCLDCRLFPVCLGGCMNDNTEGKPVLDCDAFLERQIDFLLRAYAPL